MQADALAHWRVASRIVRKKSVLKKLFDTIAPKYIDRDGGYTRILKLGHRLGDNARTVLLELVGTEVTDESPAKKGKKEAGKKDAPAGEKTEAKGKKTAKKKEKKSTKKETKKTAPAEKTAKDVKKKKEVKPKKAKSKEASEEKE